VRYGLESTVDIITSRPSGPVCVATRTEPLASWTSAVVFAGSVIVERYPAA
jgi:hypothetical protein